jgi:phosphatidylglycerophosphate synthase
LVFRVISDEPSPWFLGLRAGERNARVVQRLGQLSTPEDPRDQMIPALRVPAGVVITPALVAALPPPDGIWHLTWHPSRPPIVWRGPALSAVEGPGAAGPVTRQLPDGAALDVSTAAARRRSAWRLLRASGKPTDGWLSRHVHRKISRLCSYVLLRLGLTANHATFLTLCIGIAAAWLLAQTTHKTMIAGALLLWCASIADGIDGEMARLTLSESALGEHLDTSVDHATHLLAFAGVMVGWWRQGMSRAGWALAIVVAIGLPATVLWGVRLIRQSRVEASPFLVDTKPIELAVTAAARETGAPALRMASALFVLFRREAFSLSFFLVSLFTGRRVVYPTLVAIGLAIATLTLAGYREPIARALRGQWT